MIYISPKPKWEFDILCLKTDIKFWFIQSRVCCWRVSFSWNLFQNRSVSRSATTSHASRRRLALVKPRVPATRSRVGASSQRRGGWSSSAHRRARVCTHVRSRARCVNTVCTRYTCVPPRVSAGPSRSRIPASSWRRQRRAASGGAREEGGGGVSQNVTREGRAATRRSVTIRFTLRYQTCRWPSVMSA